MILLKKDDYKTSNKKIVIYSKNKNAIDKAEQKSQGQSVLQFILKQFCHSTALKLEI